MIEPLNSSIEVGLRSLIVLDTAYPAELDLAQLVLLDHALLHSADVGGPESLLPRFPLRAGEVGIKRQLVEAGLHVMMGAGLVEMHTTSEGFRYAASEEASSFLRTLQAEYANRLHERAEWVVSELGALDADELRSRMRSIFEAWSEEFHTHRTATGGDDT